MTLPQARSRAPPIRAFRRWAASRRFTGWTAGRRLTGGRPGVHRGGGDAARVARRRRAGRSSGGKRADEQCARWQNSSPVSAVDAAVERVRVVILPGMGDRDNEEEIWQVVSLVRQLPSLSAERMTEAAGGKSGGQGRFHEIKR